MSRAPEIYEYDPDYQVAYQSTMEYQARRLRYAIDDMGNEIARSLMPVLESTSLALRAIWTEFHVGEVAGWSWARRYWHFLTGHRR